MSQGPMIIMPQSTRRTQGLDWTRLPLTFRPRPQDTSARWENAIQLMEAIGNSDVRTYLKKRGNHRMLDDEDLKLQLEVITELLENYPVPDGPAAASRL